MLLNRCNVCSPLIRRKTDSGTWNHRGKARRRRRSCRAPSSRGAGGAVRCVRIQSRANGALPWRSRRRSDAGRNRPGSGRGLRVSIENIHHVCVRRGGRGGVARVSWWCMIVFRSCGSENTKVSFYHHVRAHRRGEEGGGSIRILLSIFYVLMNYRR